jgi:hypothetical protein
LTTHEGLTGTAVHGLGSASTLTAGATGASLVQAATVDTARGVLGLAAFATGTLLHTAAAYGSYEIARFQIAESGTAPTLTALAVGDITIVANAYRNAFNNNYRTTTTRAGFFAQAQKSTSTTLADARGAITPMWTGTDGIAATGGSNSMVITLSLEVSVDGGTVWATIAGQQFDNSALVRVVAALSGTPPASMARIELFSELELRNLRGITLISANVVAL